MARRETPSLDLCLNAVAALGGENTASVLGQAILAIVREDGQEDPEPLPLDLCIEAVRLLGGESTLSRMGQAILGIVVESRAPFAPPKSTQNLTAQWLARNGKHTRVMLIEHLQHKLPTSRRVSVVEDHVQTFLCRLVEKDTLAPHLAAGKTPQPSVLRIWCYQSACTEMRGWGVDASLRTSRGAKTNRDRMADAGKRPVVAIHSTESRVERRYEIENGEVVTDLHDPYSRSAEDDMISEETFDRARELVLKKIAGAGPRYARLLESLLDGAKRKDLARETGVSANRMATMLSRIREVLRNDETLSS